MRPDRMEFRVTQLSAEVVEGVPVVWRNGAFPSGPLTIELDEGTGVHASNGVLDYSRKRAAAEFHVRLSFPELAQMLEDLGAERSWTQPVRAVLHSEGVILEDHSFLLSGPCDLWPHPLFPPGAARAVVLPGH